MPLTEAISSALIGAAGTIGAAGASAGISAGAASAKDRKSYYYTRLLSDRQYEQNYNLWREQRNYNEQLYRKYQSPEAMMRQYRAAGLNPNLVASNGANGTPAAAEAAPYQTNRFDATMPDLSALNSLASLPGQYFQNLNLQEQNEVLKTQANKNTVEGFKIMRECDEVIARIDKEISETNLNKADLDLKNQEKKYYGLIRQATLDNILASTTNLDQQTSKLAQDIVESDARIRYMDSQKGLVDEQTAGQRFDNAVKKFHAALADQGIDPSDPWYARYLQRLLTALTDGQNLDDIVRDIKGWIHKRFDNKEKAKDRLRARPAKFNDLAKPRYVNSTDSAAGSHVPKVFQSSGY